MWGALFMSSCPENIYKLILDKLLFTVLFYTCPVGRTERRSK